MKETFSKIFKKIRDEFFTIPNMLSLVRLFLIPIIVYFYTEKRNNLIVCLLLLISSATDIVDGYIARHFNMVTDFGKFLDPLADKLTQLSVMACLVSHFSLMLLPLAVLTVKELSSFAMRFALFKKTERVDGAKWHGKLSTVLIVLMMAIHLLFDDMDRALSSVIILGVTAFMTVSAVLYAIDCVRSYRASSDIKEA